MSSDTRSEHPATDVEGTDPQGRVDGSHVRWFSEPAANGLVFIGPLGGRLLRRNFRRLWVEAVGKVGLDPAGVHFHDLRHTGNNLAAATGASTKELMARMGHSTMRAALIYQHATGEADPTDRRGAQQPCRQAHRHPTGR